MEWKDVWEFIVAHPWFSFFIVLVVLGAIVGPADKDKNRDSDGESRAKDSSKKKHRYIGSAVQYGSSVKVYDETGSYLFSLQGELVGFTSTTVSIKKGNYVKVYDETGRYRFGNFYREKK